MDTIFIKNLRCTGVHGLTEREHSAPQEFVISVEADVGDTTRAAEMDDIAYATDYRVMRDIATDVIASPHQNLLETLTHMIATRILSALPHVREVRVSLEKSEIWKNGVPGVVVRRRRE